MSAAQDARAEAVQPTLVAAMVTPESASDALPQGPRPQAVRGDGFVSPQQPAAAYVPHDMRWKPERACLPVMGVQASSESGRSRATAVADFDLRTRWTPAGSGPQWLTLDLGTVRDVAAVSLVWYSARRAEIRCVVEVSADGVRFTAIDALPLTGRGTQTVTRTFASAQARFIRLQLDTVRGACPSVYEAGVHGTSE